ncbi:PilZ domain-containing protein [Colwellia sp. 1_MG-2023]|uniref:PilZ domain-containing protein n=1 Tax=Colwellia sp. 1_MG-2023 TaxID=3062649 RepID=UPI0026E1C0F7|nr:PilZ domain-containing protein [Colwellia sp. 1_MG-2023]MDO6445306.1 PilZ domain-containing protein [Colwellia sp. 1_MG-2023]
MSDDIPTINNQDGEERRKSFRLDMEKELVDITWTHDSGQEINKKIVCVDFSKGGLKLDCDQSIPINTEVTIRFKAAAANCQILKGKVIRCLEQENGWFELALKLNQ